MFLRHTQTETKGYMYKIRPCVFAHTLPTTAGMNGMPISYMDSSNLEFQALHRGWSEKTNTNEALDVGCSAFATARKIN